MYGEHFLVTMRDEMTGETVVRRIHKSCGFVPCGDCDTLGSEEQQRRGIERWISDHGNEQHETVLALVAWELETLP